MSLAVPLPASLEGSDTGRMSKYALAVLVAASFVGCSGRPDAPSTGSTPNFGSAFLSGIAVQQSGICIIKATIDVHWRERHEPLKREILCEDWRSADGTTVTAGMEISVHATLGARDLPVE